MKFFCDARPFLLNVTIKKIVLQKVIKRQIEVNACQGYIYSMENPLC